MPRCHKTTRHLDFSLFVLHSSLKSLSFLVLVYSVINSQRRAQHFDEALCLFGSPAVLHLAIFSELGLEQVVSRINAYALESQWTELQYGSAVNRCRALQAQDTDSHARTCRTSLPPGLSSTAATCSTCTSRACGEPRLSVWVRQPQNLHGP